MDTATVQSRQFKLDLASLFPMDYLLGAVLKKRQPVLRLNRLLRKDRVQKFMEQTETRSSMPNAFRVGVVVWYIAVSCFLSACYAYIFICTACNQHSSGDHSLERLSLLHDLREHWTRFGLLGVRGDEQTESSRVS